MDLDLRPFFSEAPRMNSEMKSLAKGLAAGCLRHVVDTVRKLAQNESVTPRHVKLAVLVACADPIMSCTRDGIAIQITRVKCAARILCRAVDEAVNALAEGNTSGNLDRKLLRSTKQMLQSEFGEYKFSKAGIVSIAAVVSEFCGILLNAAGLHLKEQGGQTLTPEIFQANCVKHRLTTGDVHTNSSLLRLLALVRDRVDQGEAADASKKRAFDRVAFNKV